MENPPIYLANVNDLVTLPDVYFKVKDLVHQHAGTSDLANVIALDPALTTRFLSIANSALFSSSTEISTVSRAVTLLGTQLVHDIVLASSVSGLFDGIPADVVDVREFWEGSVRCGVIAKSIADQINVLNSGHVFIEGLLADVGHVIMYQYEHEKMIEILNAQQQSSSAVYLLEREILGYDYCDVGGYLTKQWDLPDGIWQVLTYHQEPRLADGYELETAIVHAARRLADLSSTQSGIPELDPTAMELIGMSSEGLMDLYQETWEAINATIATFGGVRKAA